jgi:hypothetical protein
MRAHFPKLSREEALKELKSFLAEIDAGWERDGLDWAPEVLNILRPFVAEASNQLPDYYRLEVLREEVYAYFKRNKSMKGISFVLGWVDMVYGDRESDVG